MRKIAKEGQHISEIEEMIQEIKDKSAEQQLHLQDHSREFQEQKSKIAT